MAIKIIEKYTFKQEIRDLYFGVVNDQKRHGQCGLSSRLCSYMNIFNCVVNETAEQRVLKKHKCARCNRPLRRVSHGDREFWRCEGWFDTGDACFAAFDDVTIKEGIDLEKLDWPISDDEKIH